MKHVYYNKYHKTAIVYTVFCLISRTDKLRMDIVSQLELVFHSEVSQFS